jgi:hypothetical protein
VEIRLGFFEDYQSPLKMTVCFTLFAFAFYITLSRMEADPRESSKRAFPAKIINLKSKGRVE